MLASSRLVAPQVQNEKRKLEAELEVIQKTKAELSKETHSLESELCSLR